MNNLLIGSIITVILIVILVIYYIYQSSGIKCLGGASTYYTGLATNIIGCYCPTDYGWDGSNCIPCISGSNTNGIGAHANVDGCYCPTNYGWGGYSCVACNSGSSTSYLGLYTNTTGCRCRSDYGWDGLNCITCGTGSSTSNTGPLANTTGCYCPYDNLWYGTRCVDYATSINEIIFTNGDFEADTDVTDYSYITPSGWNGSGSIVVIKIPSNSWSIYSGSAYSGSYICGLEYKDTYIEQYFKTVIGDNYTISCYIDKRRTDVTQFHNVTAYIDNIPQPEQININLGWSLYSFTFTATNTYHLLKIINTSPLNTSPTANDLTIYIDLVRIVNNTNSTIKNGDFEADYPSSSGSPSGWTTSGTVLYIKIPSILYGILTSVCGLYVCMLQNTNSYIKQSLSMTIGSHYLILFYLYSQNASISVLMDSVSKFDQSISSSTWTPYRFMFMATNTFHIITFLNNTSVLNSNLYIDNISINKIY
jgi:hypothetical protein